MGAVNHRPAVPPAPGHRGLGVARGGAGQLEVLPLPQDDRPRPAHPRVGDAGRQHQSLLLNIMTMIITLRCLSTSPWSMTPPHSRHRPPGPRPRRVYRPRRLCPGARAAPAPPAAPPAPWPPSRPCHRCGRWCRESQACRGSRGCRPARPGHPDHCGRVLRPDQARLADRHAHQHLACLRDL